MSILKIAKDDADDTIKRTVEVIFHDESNVNKSR